MSFNIPLASADRATKLVETFTAGENISALQVIYLDASAQALIATKDNTYTEARALGIALDTVTTGQSVRVLTFGIVNDGSFSFAVDALIFLDTSGNLTTSVAASGEFLVPVALSLGPGSIFIRIEEPELTP